MRNPQDKAVRRFTYIGLGIIVCLGVSLGIVTPFHWELWVSIPIWIILGIIWIIVYYGLID